MAARSSRYRLAAALHLASALCLVALALGLFYEPLSRVLGPRLAPIMPTSFRIPLLSRLAAAEGFMLHVVSVPPGGAVAVDGGDRGAAPVFTNVACSDGQEVAISVRKEGFPVWQRVVKCRVGESLLVRARL